MSKKTHGKTASGKPITDDLVAGLTVKAEAGYDVDEMLRRRGGRPPIGSAAASVESVGSAPGSVDSWCVRIVSSLEGVDRAESVSVGVPS